MVGNSSEPVQPGTVYVTQIRITIIIAIVLL